MRTSFTTRKLFKGFAALLVITSLSGCAVMRQLGLAPKTIARDRQLIVKIGSPITDIGRSQISAGNFGLAIATFGNALAVGEAQAPAFNGLGVAYAKLGRQDLAERYFRLAIDADPGNSRYAANLGRLAGTEHAGFQPASAGLASAANNMDAEQRVFRRKDPDLGKLIRVSARDSSIRIAWASVRSENDIARPTPNAIRIVFAKPANH